MDQELLGYLIVAGKALSTVRSNSRIKSLLYLFRVYPLQPCKTVDHLKETHLHAIAFLDDFCQILAKILSHSLKKKTKIKTREKKKLEKILTSLR